MFMPTIFHENLFDDFFDPFWNDGALERAMNREERETFGKRGANMMKTDVKQTADGSYDVAVDLPGCKKEDVQMELNDGYLTIQAVRSHSNDEKDKEGRYLRRETFSGTCARSFYVGDTVKKGQVLGIIEAMKLMNEIESEYDGVVEAILVNNEEVVEYGQPLFRIK